MAIKQIIEIEVTWDSYNKKMNLNGLVNFIASTDLPMKRISVKEKK
jgi:hypothetical protein